MARDKEVTSVIKAIEIMKCLSEGISKLSDIARKLQYDKSNVHRILKTLEKAGITIQDPVSQQYYPGALILTLASQSMRVHEALNHCAVKHMEALRDSVKESVLLQIPLGGQRLIVAAALYFRSLTYYANAGDSHPIHTGAAGKLLLSLMATTDFEKLFQELELTPITAKTITDKAKYLRQIEQIRRQRYLIEFGEFFEGAGAMAVPVDNYICPVALNIVGLEDRLRPNSETMLAELKASAKQISKELQMVYGNKRSA